MRSAGGTARPGPRRSSCPSRPPIEYTVAAPVVPAPAVNQFGSPLVEAARPHRAVAPTSSGGAMTLTTKIGIGILALLVVAGCAIWALKVGSGGDSTAALPSGPRGPAAQAAAKLDALSLAAAEETVYAGRQSYLAIPTSSGVVEMGQTVVHLSPQDSASVTLNPSATGYCVVVTSASPTTQARSVAVYVSTLGGIQPLATTCPASYSRA